MKLPRFVRRSLRRKVTALVVSTTLLTLTVIAIVLLYASVTRYRAATIADLQTQAEIVGRASAPALDFNDPLEAERDLAMLAAREDVLRATLYAADGSVFAKYAREGEIAPVPAKTRAPGFEIKGNRLTLAYPIFEDKERLGTLVLVAHYGVRAHVLGYVFVLLGVLAGALVAALLLAAWLERAVTEPVLSVVETARRIAEKRDFSVRAVKSTEDEIGTLADAVNDMLVDLEREITERRSAEETLLVVDRRKDEFLATLAHELRNPLAPIRNALYLMSMPGIDARTLGEARSIIERQVRQLVRLVDDLLEVSRITTGKLALRKERVELRGIASAALEAVEPLILEKGHRLSLSLPPEGLSIEADPTRLAQIFTNLLNNAAKFTPPGGSIEFSLEVADGEMVGRVRDDGVGLRAEMIEPIFEMFAQADRSLERTTMGLGVGLSISRKLAELHGGTLRATSEGPGTGAEFVVRIPAFPRLSAEKGSPGNEAAGTHESAGPRGVLIVDDNRDFALTLGRLLRSRGYEVRVEHDGAAGLAAAVDFRPAVALLDLGMPKLNGYDLARRLRTLPATARSTLIAVTGWGQEDDRRRSQAAGFDGHLVKPIDPDALFQLLQGVRARTP